MGRSACQVLFFCVKKQSRRFHESRKMSEKVEECKMFLCKPKCIYNCGCAKRPWLWKTLWTMWKTWEYQHVFSAFGRQKPGVEWLNIAVYKQYL